MKPYLIASTSLVIDRDTKIERSLFIPEGYTLGDLHIMLQAAYGWFNYHCHQFEIGKDDYAALGLDSDQEPHVIDADKTLLSDLICASGRATLFKYSYDFGDGWEIEVKLFPPPSFRFGELGFDEEGTLPFCFRGCLADPVDDCGGPSGYKSLGASGDSRDWLADMGRPNWKKDVFEKDRVNRFLSDYFSAIKPGQAGTVFNEGSKARKVWQKAHERAYPMPKRQRQTA